MRSFFFASRRRHTRYWRDWSSDVCSSDLDGIVEPVDVAANGLVGLLASVEDGPPDDLGFQGLEERLYHGVVVAIPLAGRSEERRVGKECRSRWSPYH